MKIWSCKNTRWPWLLGCLVLEKLSFQLFSWIQFYIAFSLHSQAELKHLWGKREFMWWWCRNILRFEGVTEGTDCEFNCFFVRRSSFTSPLPTLSKYPMFWFWIIFSSKLFNLFAVQSWNRWTFRSGRKWNLNLYICSNKENPAPSRWLLTGDCCLKCSCAERDVRNFKFWKFASNALCKGQYQCIWTWHTIQI